MTKALLNIEHANDDTKSMQSVYDMADLQYIIAQNPDVDALIEAILSLEKPSNLSHSEQGLAKWEYFQFVVELLRKRRYESAI